MSAVMVDRSFNTWDWQREIHRRCGEAGVSFEFDPKTNTAYTTGSKIVVPCPPVDATQQDYDILRAQVIHECGHIARPGAFDVAKENGLTNNNPLFMIFNQLEDRIQEHECAYKRVGDSMALDRLHSLYNEKFVRESPSWKFTNDVHRSLSMRLSVSMHIALQSAVDWMPRVAAVQPAVERAMATTFGPGAQRLVDDLTREGWVERITALRGKTPAEVYTLSKELYTRLFPELPPPPPPTPGKGNGTGKVVGKKADDGMPAEISEAMAKMPWELLLRSEHTDADNRPTGGGMSIDWASKPRNKAIPKWFPRVVAKQPSEVRGTAPVVPYALIGDVRRELQAKTKAKVTREKLHGRLDRRNLTRLVMPQVGDGTYNRSIFQQLTQGLKLDTAVTILIDCSGSMRGKKFDAAKRAALSLYDLCAVALRLPCEVLGFTHASNTPQIHICKAYNEARVHRDVLFARLNGAGEGMVGNSDGDALMYAFSRQMPLRNARKIIIVLSDGCPVEAGNSDGDATLRAAIAEIRSKGTELYGIGIMDENVRRYYSKQAPVVNNDSDVPRALLEVLRDVLQRQLDAA